jgi:hypothetical protein
MANLTTPTYNPNTVLTADTIDTTPTKPAIGLPEPMPARNSPEMPWQVEQWNTTLQHHLAALPDIRPHYLRGYVCISATDSRPVIQLSNAPGISTQTAPTDNPTFANETHIASSAELEQLISETIREAISKPKIAIYFCAHPPRYLAPQTPVLERIDQLILDEDGNEELLLDRREQAVWLKHIFATHWGLHLPQPFIGFDLDEGFFIASWQSHSECNSLTIDAKDHKGWYDPWPAEEGDNPLPGEIDLNSEAEWQLLRIALTTTQS